MESYSGGSVIAGLLNPEQGGLHPGNLTAIVRTDDQAQKLANLGINVLNIDLTDGQAVTDAVSSRNSTI